MCRQGGQDALDVPNLGREAARQAGRGVGPAQQHGRREGGGGGDASHVRCAAVAVVVARGGGGEHQVIARAVVQDRVQGVRCDYECGCDCCVKYGCGCDCGCGYGWCLWLQAAAEAAGRGSGNGCGGGWGGGRGGQHQIVGCWTTLDRGGGVSCGCIKGLRRQLRGSAVSAGKGAEGVIDALSMHPSLQSAQPTGAPNCSMPPLAAQDEQQGHRAAGAHATEHKHTRSPVCASPAGTSTPYARCSSSRSA